MQRITAQNSTHDSVRFFQIQMADIPATTTAVTAAIVTEAFLSVMVVAESSKEKVLSLGMEA
jgi:hypothetical protein